MSRPHTEPPPEPVYPVSTVSIGDLLDDTAQPPGWYEAAGQAFTEETLRLAMRRLSDTGYVGNSFGVTLIESLLPQPGQARRAAQEPFKDEPDQ